MYKQIFTFCRRGVFFALVVIVAGGLLSGCGKGSSTAGSFLMSIDGGETFEPRVGKKDESIAGVDILSMTHSAQDPKKIYIGTRKKGIFMTDDAGESWHAINFAPERVYGIAVDDAQTIYATGVYQGLARVYKSVDGGEEWEEIYTEPVKKAVITALAMEPSDQNVLYVGMSTGLIIKTTDGGKTWADVYKARGPVIKIAFDVQDPQTVYFALYKKGLLKTRTAGKDVQDFTRKLAGTDKSVTAVRHRRSTSVYSLETDPRTPGVVYVGTDSGIYRSDDYGVTWRELDIIKSQEKIPVKAIAVNPHNTHQIIYSIGRLLYRSDDTMTKWTPVQISASRAASVIQYDTVDENIIYIGTKSSK